jgi:hypothetical protein
VTQQHIVGEFSSLLAELQPAPGAWSAAVDDLRQEVESSPLPRLRALADRALNLTDAICLTALEDGDVTAFRRHANTARALADFTETARLLW